jgi:hypothetical protein
MPVAPVSDHAPDSDGAAPAHSDRACEAVRLAAIAIVAIATSIVLFAVAYAIGGADATADNWVGVSVVVLLLGGVLASLAAFALAVVALIECERWALLWLPLSVLPALLVFLVLGEAFWWE